MTTRRGASAWTRRGAGGTKATGKNARRLSSDDESDQIRPIVTEGERGRKKRKDSPVGVEKPSANKKLLGGTPSSLLRGETMSRTPKPGQLTKVTRGEKTVSDADSDSSDDTQLIQPVAATKEKRAAKPPTKSSGKAQTGGKSPGKAQTGGKAAAKSTRAANKSGAKPGATKSAQTGEGVPEPISLARFFGGSSERLKAASQARDGELDVESVARSDHKFLQSAYQGVQETNNRLMTLLEGLRESHDRAVLERDEFATETKRLREEVDSLKEGRPARPRLMSPGTPANPFRGTPGSSLTAAVGQRQPLLVTMPSSFSLLGKTAMKMAGQIAEEWTVGPIMASHLTNGEEDALIAPFFNSKLPHQHITPFLTDISDVREPFYFEFTSILETDVTGGSEIASASDFERQFKNAFERRRAPTSKKNEEAEEGANEPPGLFQRFIDRRRNVRGDRIGKPLAKFIALSKETVPGIGEEHAVWRLLSEKRSADDCFFFTRPGAKELFKEIFRPPFVKGRMVLTITQLCMLDVSAMMSGAGKKAKGKGYEGQVRALGTELCDEIWSLGDHPCLCCWTADVGGLGEERTDEDEAADNGRDGEEENEGGKGKVDGDDAGDVQGDSDGGADAGNSDHEGKEEGDRQKDANDA